jgi:hypothetical protein
MRDDTDFGTVMELAIESICPKNIPGNFSSKDIPRIELSGPTQPHLTIVDLPGFIQTSNIYQAQEDVDAIAEIAYHYMKSSRTIILAIVSAAYDYAIQPVLKKAREVDPRGIRTIGIITKPDKAEATCEDEFVTLAKNNDIKLDSESSTTTPRQERHSQGSKGNRATAKGSQNKTRCVR